jgi:protein involved in polysaccharide export with SLBB domain
MIGEMRLGLLRAVRRSVCSILAAVLLSLSLPANQPAAAQSSTNPADLLQLFQSLTPEQQDAIMKQFGMSGAGGANGPLGALSSLLGGAAGAKAAAGRASRTQESQQRAEAAESEEQEEQRIPGLKALDWVVIQTNLPSEKPAAPAPVPTLIPPGIAGAPGLGLPQGGGAQAALASALAANANAQNAPAQAAPAAPGSDSASNDTLPADSPQRRLRDLAELIASRNPYRLSREGELTLPGFAPIALLGLSDEQASLRLNAEPGLHGLNIQLVSLPLRKTGAEGLRPFGYDLFDRQTPSTFAPEGDVPVPSDYIVGPGDELNVQLYGSQNRTLKLVVSRDGRVNLPDLGPVNVAGERFTAVKEQIESLVANQMLGVRASVSMGDTRAIRVLVLGEVRRPGTYTMSGLSTMTSALFAAGGVKRIGSLRAIELKRAGSLAQRLDLYDLLIRGNTTGDAKLLQGDVVFVPPVGNTASISGEVHRPAIYELKGETTVVDLVRLAGGLTPEADTSKAMLTGYDSSHERVVIAVQPLTAGPSHLLRNGDLVSVARLRPTLDSGIQLQGYVYAPGAFAWRSGIRLSDVIHSVDELRPDADLHYVLIRRELPPDRHVSVLSANLADALADPGGPADLALAPRDRITVFDLSSGRDHVIQPVLAELRLQSNASRPSQVVEVAGHVRVPGTYPLESGMRVADLIRAGGGTADEAYGRSAELVRYQVVGGEQRNTELINIDLSAALRGDAQANLRLEPFDLLTIKEVPEWANEERVTLRGEVRFPGVYSIRRGETLKSVLDRAGGLSPYAFPEGGVFTRESLRQREQEQIDMLAERMQRDVALLALQAAGAGQATAASALSVGQSLLGQLKGAKAVGRLVIDLPKLVGSPTGSTYDVVLRGGDTLSVPRYLQQVTVIGEVQNVTSHLYNPHYARDDYINLSGGFTHRADKSRIYIVRASGSVVGNDTGGWFQRDSAVSIRPGDTIVVPLDAEHIPALPLWTQVTQILYNLSIAVLAIKSL